MATRLDSLKNHLTEKLQVASELHDIGFGRTDAQEKKLSETVNEIKKLQAEIDAEVLREQEYQEAVKGATDRIAQLGQVANRPQYPGGGTFLGFVNDGNRPNAGQHRLEPPRQSSNDDWREISLDDPDREVKLILGSKYDALSSKEYHMAFQQYLRLGGRAFDNSDIRRLGLEAGADGSGGLLVPTEMLREIIQRKGAPTRIAGLCRRLVTNSPEVVIPYVNDYGNDFRYTSAARVTWTGERPTSDTDHRMNIGANTFGQKKIEVHQAMMSLPFTTVLLDDASVDVMSWVANEMASTRDKVYDDMVLNGSGNGQPKGILTSALLSTAPGFNPQNHVQIVNIGNPISPDGILDLTNSIEEEDEENLRIVMRRIGVWPSIRKLKDLDNRYLVGFGEASSLGASPDRVIDGHPVVFSGFMPGLGAGSLNVLFGNLQGYAMVERPSYSVQILREISALQGMVQILAKFRVGGDVIQPWTLKVGAQS